MWHALKFSMGFPAWCRIQSIWQHGRRAKFVCRVVRECISGAACRCALAAFVCPVARCAPRIYSSAIVDTALGVLAVDDCQALYRAARRRMRASLDHFYVRQLSRVSIPPLACAPRYPKPIACCAVRERIYPGTPDSHLAGWSARLC